MTIIESFCSWFFLSGVSVYLGTFILYRLFLHPLRKFPGSPLAALTGWHWDFHASNVDYLRNLHARYGPVVRIAPNELHFSDPRAYPAIYSIGSKFTKDPQFYTTLNHDKSSFGLTDPRKAKARREIISPLFSRRAILKLENVVQNNIDVLIAQTIAQKDRPVDLHYAFRSLSLDIITSYCFASSWSTLTYPSFQHPMLHAMTQRFRLRWVMHAFPFLNKVIPALGPLVVRINPVSKALINFRRHIIAQIDEVLRDPGSLVGAEHETVYHHLMSPRSTKGPKDIPSRASLIDEAINLVIAGSDTVGGTCTVGVFHVLNNPQIHANLVKELNSAWPDTGAKVGYEVLEKLPYLTAVIKESLRVFGGVVSPAPRVVGPSSARIAGVDVPAGTIVSISSPFIHENPDIFPDPSTFNPDRWLQPNSRQLENYLVPFSRGPRSCLGVNLAWCELFLTFANIFRHLDMEIFQTSVADLKYGAYFLPLFTGNHFHVKVKGRTA